MLKLVLCYDNGSMLLKEILEHYMKKYPEISFESYNEDFHKERKKSHAVKSLFAARMTPFCGVLDDDVIKKGFYSEVRECTDKNIVDYIRKNFIAFLKKEDDDAPETVDDKGWGLEDAILTYNKGSKND